jgi:hypothetical protein
MSSSRLVFWAFILILAYLAWKYVLKGKMG